MTPRERSPCSVIDSRNQRSKLKSIASLCARTSISMPCSNSPSTSALNSFLVCSASRAYSHGLSPCPLKSPRPEAQVPREPLGVVGAVFLYKTFQFQKWWFSVINIFPSVGNLPEVFLRRVHPPFLVLCRRIFVEVINTLQYSQATRTRLFR